MIDLMVICLEKVSTVQTVKKRKRKERQKINHLRAFQGNSKYLFLLFQMDSEDIDPTGVNTHLPSSVSPIHLLR